MSLPDRATDRLQPAVLTDDERAVYEWQMWVDGFGETGQSALKGASVLISRIGGLGGIVAYELAAAGIGRLVLAHAGKVHPSDLNRQLLMTHQSIGTPRMESAVRRLHDLNPRLEIVGVPENITERNVDGLVAQVDLIVDCAPLFEERFLLNRAAVHARKPIVECAMYELEASITTVVPGRTPCLGCWCPEPPAPWKRQFPVFGAVSGSVGCLAAMEAIKVLSGLGEPLYNRMLMFDLRDMKFSSRRIERNPACPICTVLT
jgi:molybdopterin/thiamine biosynthesis adenylyltransferase